MRALTESDVTFETRIEQELDAVRGNALASGDTDLDRRIEDEILAQLEAGNIEAWCSITVVAKWRGHEGRDHIGCCSHLPNEEQPSLAKQVEQTIADYGLRQTALDNLNAKLEELASDLHSLET